MKRMKYIFLAAIAAALSFTCVSCDKSDNAENTNSAGITLDAVSITLEIERGSLPAEYVDEISQVTARRYTGDEGMSSIETLIEKCIVIPMQEKVDEVAMKSGCYDFSVTITASKGDITGQVLYRKTVVPVRPQ